MIRIDVLGTPAPKGSDRIALRGGKPRFVPGSSKTNAEKQRSFAAAIRDQMALVLGDAPGPCFVGKPLAVAIVFRLKRPAAHWSKKGGLLPSAPSAPSVKPDVDKLARQAVDVLTGAVFDDDARIVELLVRKEYAAPGREGASIVVDMFADTVRGEQE